MIIDFKEIPEANKGGGQQDAFEQFARDFLAIMGYVIESHPDRGADGKKDLIVSEIRKGVSGKETKFLWLVSCKHKIYSGNAVVDTDEPDPKGRVDQHGCNGFLGFYSTIPSASLNNKLASLKPHKIEYDVFDGRRIEGAMFESSKYNSLFKRYFPNSYSKHSSLLFMEEKLKEKQVYTTTLTEDDLLQISTTGIILIDIAKIREEYYRTPNEWNKETLDKLFKYYDYSNEKIADAIFSLLMSISHQTRSRMPVEIASTIESLVLTFFPSSYEKDMERRIDNGKRCAHIAFNLVYDAFIYLDNFRIAEYGLSILKYVYRQAVNDDMNQVKQEVLRFYDDLERNLNRPERTDLENAKELLKIYRADLERKNLDYPDMPQHIYNLIHEG